MNDIVVLTALIGQDRRSTSSSWMEVTLVREEHVLDTKLNPMFLLEKKYEMENNFIHILCNSSLGDIHCEGD